MKTYTQHKKARKGLVTILNVVIIGGFMLGMMAVAYRASIRSMEAQKKVQLQLDYEAREQAFLRSIVTLAPLYAANTMIDGSNGNDPASGAVQAAKFSEMYSTAMGWSNIATARDSSNIGKLNLDPDFSKSKNGNVGDASDPNAYTVDKIVGVEGATAGDTPSGVGVAAVDNYPLPLISKNSLVVSASSASKSAPLISSDIVYKDAAGNETAFQLLDYPDIHFQYAKGKFIARQNWWKLYMHANQADRGATGVGNAAFDTNEYILSIYEIPSQLAISSSAITVLGTINGKEWDSKKVTVEGPVYAKKAKINSGDFSAVSTQQGVDFAEGSKATVGGSAAQVDESKFKSQSREEYEAANTTEFYPISKASDYARSLFIPINPGIEFLDSFATSDTDQASGNRLSKESWNGYTRGCHQCAMKLIVLETAGGTTTDQTPVAMSFYCEDSLGRQITYFVYRAAATFIPDSSWIKIPWPDDDSSFPFSTSKTSNDHPSVEIDLANLTAWLKFLDAGIDFGVNHSLLINVDYKQTTVVKPSAPAVSTDLAVVLRGCGDLRAFKKGFSLVTNLPFHIMDNFNQEGTAGFYPPVSLFAPVFRFGEGDAGSKIDITGGLGSLNTSNSGVDITDFRGVTSNSADADRITATLTSLKALNELPPINIMNWLVVIQKKL